ncbi:phosphoglycolate phosphatase [Primorskyibacter aestuariivivens]|uniref:phosphoglycolate phosphatase n=1 Tax=Primorskyibacter aestuariivivens TaxID=1888912 RepID=UPI002300D888|nr:phosphoglycolate phosphatase [Primorskyibacter aestuariivivens]MDA7427911.1 phosphoglycolate phosphatase [Primorskyibacter aestuariivivens]
MARIVFDLDGTLIDSAGEIHAAVQRMLDEVGGPTLDLPTVTGFVGNGLPKLVERVIRATGLDMARHADLTDRVLSHFNALGGSMTAPYPGVMQALSQLRSDGHALAICTNKPEAPARHILETLGFAPFDAVVGGDTLPTRKPDPDMLWAAAEALGDGPLIYVGDSDVDAETAERAQVPFLLFTEGYRKSAVEALYHTARFDRFDDLPDLVAGTLSGV